MHDFKIQYTHTPAPNVLIMDFLLLLSHTFWTRNARKLIKGSKDLDYSLVSNKN